jgi:hypothetical protein
MKRYKEWSDDAPRKMRFCACGSMLDSRGGREMNIRETLKRHCIVTYFALAFHSSREMSWGSSS